MSNETLWYLSRATGLASVVLLTLVVVLGIVTSGRRRPFGERATIVMGLHRWLSLGMVAFLATHIVTAIVETYVSIDWISLVVPFTSAYAPLWVGLGTLAFDLLVAVLATSYWRHRMTERAWKAVHWLSYLMWPLAIIHGIALGTANQPLLRAATICCGAVGAGALAWRLTTSYADRDRRRDVLAGGWS
ncbi:MAG: ferric reductase-like transmembrane domain-containing protein [Dermatophilaceae bacterium]